jgi:hypothetical protein
MHMNWRKQLVLYRMSRRAGTGRRLEGGRVAPGGVERLSRRTVMPTTVEPHGSQQSSRLFERITSACAAVLRGIVRPCRWREFVEPATAKKTVETAEVNIEPWRNSEWRRVASVFLGSELSPPVEDIPTEPPRDEPAPTTNVYKPEASGTREIVASPGGRIERLLMPHNLR